MTGGRLNTLLSMSGLNLCIRLMPLGFIRRKACEPRGHMYSRPTCPMWELAVASKCWTGPVSPGVPMDLASCSRAHSRCETPAGAAVLEVEEEAAGTGRGKASMRRRYPCAWSLHWPPHSHSSERSRAARFSACQSASKTQDGFGLYHPRARK